jgi:hypothetical protein
MGTLDPGDRILWENGPKVLLINPFLNPKHSMYEYDPKISLKTKLLDIPLSRSQTRV